MSVRVLNVLMILVMAFSVAVQFNDPDPERWIFAYGMTAVLCVVWAMGHLTSTVALVYIWVMVGLMGLTGLQSGGEPHMGWGPAWGPLAHEVMREQLGLSMAASWLVVLGVIQARKEDEARA